MVEHLRWRANNFTINYLPCVKCFILQVVQSQPNLMIKYYMASTICVTNLDTMLQKDNRFNHGRPVKLVQACLSAGQI